MSTDRELELHRIIADTSTSPLHRKASEAALRYSRENPELTPDEAEALRLRTEFRSPDADAKADELEADSGHAYGDLFDPNPDVAEVPVPRSSNTDFPVRPSEADEALAEKNKLPVDPDSFLAARSRAVANDPSPNPDTNPDSENDFNVAGEVGKTLSHGLSDPSDSRSIVAAQAVESAVSNAYGDEDPNAGKMPEDIVAEAEMNRLSREAQEDVQAHAAADRAAERDGSKERALQAEKERANEEAVSEAVEVQEQDFPNQEPRVFDPEEPEFPTLPGPSGKSDL